MAETTEPPSDAGTSQADAMALAAEAEAAEAEALAAAARARARAARLKREALAMAPAEDENVPEEYADWEDAEDYDDYDDYEAADQEAARSASWRRRLRVRLPRLSTIAMAAAVVIICGFTGLSGYIVWRDSRRIHERAFRRGARRGDFTGHQFRWGERRTTCVAAQSDRDRRGGTVQDVES
ncbi:membrane protein [Mycobacterium tuberculosis M2435]|nr:membrane protein [Mycobacterium tuberculosis M2435]